jgi:hypothetical protein
LENPILFAEPRQLLALDGRQTRAPFRAIGLRVLHPPARRRRDQIQLAGHGGDALALIED